MLRSLNFIFILIVITFFIPECSVEEPGSTSPALETVAVSVEDSSTQMISSLVQEDNRTWIRYHDEPYLNYGVQLKVGDILTENFQGDADHILNVYFQKAKELHFQTVIISIPWRFVEFDKDQYDFNAYLDKVIGYTEKYDLLLQLMWYGSNVCGWPTMAPDYVLNDRDIYTRIDNDRDPWAAFDYSDADLLEREILALHAVMEYIAERDTDQRVVMVQIENEPDNVSQYLTNWNSDWEKHLWVEGQKESILVYLNKLGEVVHHSSHPVLTRFNAFGANINAEDVFSLPGIDMVGRNLYVFMPGDENTEGSFLSLSGVFNYSGNANHTPENGGQYDQNVNLIFSAFASGQGYMIYELRTTGEQDYDFGIYRKTDTDLNAWIERDGTLKVQYDFDPSADFLLEGSTNELRNFNQLIYKVDKQLASLPPENMADFNQQNNAGLVDESKLVGRVTVHFVSNNGGEGFAMQDLNGDIYLLATRDQTCFMVPELSPRVNATAGYYDQHNQWMVERKIEKNTNDCFELNAFEAVRISNE